MGSFTEYLLFYYTTPLSPFPLEILTVFPIIAASFKLWQTHLLFLRTLLLEWLFSQSAFLHNFTNETSMKAKMIKLLFSVSLFLCFTFLFFIGQYLQYLLSSNVAFFLGNADFFSNYSRYTIYSCLVFLEKQLNIIIYLEERLLVKQKGIRCHQ